MDNDVRRVLFYAEAITNVWVELPEEDKTEDGRKEYRVGYLNVAMSGTRAAALCWQRNLGITVKA